MAAVGLEQGMCQWQQPFAEAVGEQAVVADAHEAPGQDMEEEAAQELHGFQSHAGLLVAVSVVPPDETDLLSIEGQQAMVGDGHAMGVAAEVAQHMGRAAEGRFGVNEPLLPGEFRG